MKFNKKKILIIGLLVFLSLLLYFYIYPAYTMFQTSMDVYATNLAYNSDYKLHTTPLPENVVGDICSNLDIERTSENCRGDVAVYAPEFFDEIKIYFNKLPKEERTFDAVQKKLEVYLVFCEKPGADGHYRCEYDIRGDGVFPVYFYFDKDGRYYRIIANTSIGGS
jgi:hypothetical protein